ncbi:unnamed protein product [Amaranthus hypochondriacus]
MASTLSSPSGNDSPWIEYYRPTMVSDIFGSDLTVSRLQPIARDGDIRMPNIILTVPYNDEGREAIILPADGDLLPALNDLQATPSQIKVGEKPHPLQVKKMIRNVRKGKFASACTDLNQLYEIGYSPVDIFTALYDALRNYDMPEFLKLEISKEAGSVGTRIAEAVDSYPLLCGLLAKVSPSSEIIIAASMSNNHTPA